MKIENIYETWGTVVTFNDPMEFFSKEKGFWRTLSYDRKLVVFKKMNFGLSNYGRLGYHLGLPWTKEDYKYSHEAPIEVTENNKTFVITKFSNLSVAKTGHRAISLMEMPWHADIPNRSYNPFPWRTLYMGNNPNTEDSGKTQWLNIQESIEYLSKELRELIPRITVQQQSWYDGGMSDVAVHDFIKTHPITGKKSLRLNYYVGYPGVKNSTNAWIRHVYVDGVQQPDNKLIQQYIDELLTKPNTLYRHTWDQWDIALYDNYPFIHGRTELKVQLETGQQMERLLYRMNIDHVPDQAWAQHELR